MTQPRLQVALEAQAALGAVEQVVEQHVPQHGDGREHQGQRPQVQQRVVQQPGHGRRADHQGDEFEGERMADALAQGAL
ncbi:hypothetical protein D9M71_699660 [compost metagenome]